MKDYENILENLIKKVKTEFPEPDKKLILGFMEEEEVKGIGIGRRAEFLRQLCKISLILGKGFRKTTKNDIIRVLNELKKNGYSEGYLDQYKIAFSKFLSGIGMKKLVKDEDGKTIDILKAKRVNRLNITSKDILTEEEIQKLIRSCDKLRDRCFISLLYETGARIGELANLERKDIRIENDQAIITIPTEKNPHESERESIVVYATPDLIAYLDSMGGKEPEDRLWIKKTLVRDKEGRIQKDRNGKEMHRLHLLKYNGLYSILKRACKNTGITKKVWPHLLRHSRVSHVSSELTEGIQRKMFGWSKNSPMPSHYGHLSNAKTHETILSKVYGIENNGNNGNGEEALFCPRCKAKVQEGSDNCWRCGLILNEKVRLEEDKEKEKFKKFMNWVIEQPEGKKFFGEMTEKFKG